MAKFKTLLELHQNFFACQSISWQYFVKVWKVHINHKQSYWQLKSPNEIIMQRFEPIRILFDIRCSNIEYRTLSNIEPFRTLEIFDQSNHRISNHRTSSNIEPFRILQIFDPSNHRISNIEPLIEYRDIRSIEPFDDRTSSMIEYPTMVRWFDIRRSNIELFEPSNIRRFGNPNLKSVQ